VELLSSARHLHNRVIELSGGGVGYFTSRTIHTRACPFPSELQHCCRGSQKRFMRNYRGVVYSIGATRVCIPFLRVRARAFGGVFVFEGRKAGLESTRLPERRLEHLRGSDCPPCRAYSNAWLSRLICPPPARYARPHDSLTDALKIEQSTRSRGSEKLVHRCLAIRLRA
jgi:hypothetical protein